MTQVRRDCRFFTTELNFIKMQQIKKRFRRQKTSRPAPQNYLVTKNPRAGKRRMPQQRLGRLQAFPETNLDDNLIQLPF